MSDRHDVTSRQDLLSLALEDLDPELDLLACAETDRQDEKLILIASESMAPAAVREAVASSFTNLYAEGYPPTRMVHAGEPHREHIWYQQAYQQRYGDRRYYKGVDVANFVEALAIRRAREAFATAEIPADAIYANVQPLSGAAANNAAYQALVKPGDTVMGLDLTHGGHLTHGHPLNRSGMHFDIVHYEVDTKTGRLDYDRIVEMAAETKPRLIIAGYSAYPWAIDWKRFREAADAAGGYLMADIAHVAGLVAAGVYPSPVGYADVITFTTHKTLMGPRGAIILTTNRNLAGSVDASVFPGEQGGPHVNTIAAKALILGLAKTRAYRDLQKKVLANAQYLAGALVKEGMTLAYGGTNTHLLLVDLRPHKGVDACSLTGEILSRVLDLAGLSCNKNTIAGDTNAAHPSAIRLGTPWVTQRGMGKKEMERIAGVVARVAGAIRPFCYTDTGGEIGRGKLDWETHQWARLEIQGILRPFRANVDEPEPPVHPLCATYKRRRVKTTAKNDWPLPVSFSGESADADPAILDRTDGEVFVVAGDPHRVAAFLSQLTTCDALSLDPGAVQRGFVIGRNGQVLTDVTLARLKNDDSGLAHVKVVAGPCRNPSASQWMRAISDGYTLFDDGDMISKVEGPVILYSYEGQYALTVVGKNASKAIAAADPALAKLKSGKSAAFTVGESEVLATRLDHQDGWQIVQIVAQEDAVPTLWEGLVGAGAKPVGTQVAEKILESRGLVVDPDSTVADLVGAVDPGMMALEKPYFVGMNLLPADARAGSGKKPFVWQEKEGEFKRTCLYERHAAIARKNYMVPFAGWEMPVRYGNIIEEHRAVRQAAGLFDVAHMGVLEFSGKGATQFLDMLTTNYVPWLLPGQSHYSYLLDADGQVLDDIMVYKKADDLYMVVVNAGNFDKVFAYLQAVNAGKILLDRYVPCKSVPRRIRIRDLKSARSGKDQRVDMALQGPVSRVLLLSLMDDPAARRVFSQMRRNEFLETRLAGKPAIVSGTGYTGEPVAYEMYVHPGDAPAVWDAVLEAGQPLGVTPCGLGARDSLRTEAGLPLYGHELAGHHNIGPGGAGYAAFVKLHKPFFVGKAAYIAQECRRSQAVVRLEVAGKGMRPIRQGDAVLDRNGKVIGTVTSSAVLEDGQVGLAYVAMNYTRPGLPLSIVSPPKDGPVTMEMGDRVPIPVPAVIASRFFRKNGGKPMRDPSADTTKRPICEIG